MDPDKLSERVEMLFSIMDEQILRPDSLLGRPRPYDDSEYYVGGGKFVRVEVRSFETWADLHEWVESLGSREYTIDTIRVWNGPGSMLSAIFIFERYEDLSAVKGE